MAKIFASVSKEISEREKRNMERSRKIAAQGIVLLENDGTLPLCSHKKRIALFGNGARHTVKGGTGSGDVNSRFTVNVWQGLKEAGFEITTENWLDRYDKTVQQERESYFAAMRMKMAEKGPAVFMEVLMNPFHASETVPVLDEEIRESDTEAAVYVLARSSGEGRDRRNVPGDYELTADEKEIIRKLADAYQKLIIVLNTGGVADTQFFRETRGIGAVVLMSQPGNMGGHALADVLTGKVSPSGHLTATWARHYQDYPQADSFSFQNGNLDDEYYKEGIYVGYRYFDTFGISPAYPFGYGKSYTEFATAVEDVKADVQAVKVTVKVTNTGTAYSGREVVQVYYSAPAGRLEKPYQELAAFAKTKELAPGESEVLTLSYPTASMASYDTKQAAFVMEAGSYYIRVGTHSRNTHVAAAVCLDREAVTEILSNRLVPDCEIEEVSAKNAVPYTYETEQKEKESAPRILLQAEDFSSRTVQYQTRDVRAAAAETGTEGAAWKLTDVITGRITLDAFVGQLTAEELASLCVGASRGGFGNSSVIGAASVSCPGAAGDTTSELLETRDVTNITLADGPAGLRLAKCFMTDKDQNLLPGMAEIPMPDMDLLTAQNPKPPVPEDARTYYQYCTAIPIAVLLAQTWDMELLAEAGDIVGEEMEEFGVTLWLAPGMNIHRNPLCGRNFEYFSEDPLIAGLCAAAETKGVQKHPGTGTTIKHFACNNQEDNRMHTNVHVSERALREIYLKGFEIAVKEAQPLSIMTSYNLINGIHTANNYDLLTAVARDEWGFEGIIMTDWGTTGSIDMEPGKQFRYGHSNAAGCVWAGNDLNMPGSKEDVDEILRSVDAKEGEVSYPLTKADLAACAKRVLSVIMKSSVYR